MGKIKIRLIFWMNFKVFCIFFKIFDRLFLWLELFVRIFFLVIMFFEVGFLAGFEGLKGCDSNYFYLKRLRFLESFVYGINYLVVVVFYL